MPLFPQACHDSSRASSRPSASRLVWVLAGAAAASLALGAAGCREKSESQRTFEDAVRQLTTGPRGERNPAAYARIAASLTAPPGAGSDPAAGEVTILRGVARASEGIATLAEFDEAIAGASLQLKAVDSAAGVRRVEHQMAEAAATVSYEAINRDLADQIQRLEAQAAELRRERASLESRLRDLRSQAASLDQRAADLRERAADRQLEASTSSIEAAAAAPEIRRINRNADALEQQAARLRIAASTEESEIPLIEARVEQRLRQRDLLEQRIADHRAEAASAEQRAARARAAAAEAETELQTALDAALSALGLTDPGSGNGTPGVLARSRETVRAFEAAISDARRARSRAPSRSNIGLAVASRLLGETHQRLLTALERYEQVLRSLVDAEPPLQNTDELRTLLERLETRAERAAADAAEAYETTSNALRSLRATDQQIRQGLAEAADRYQALAESFRGPQPAGQPGQSGQGGQPSPRSPGSGVPGSGAPGSPVRGAPGLGGD